MAIAISIAIVSKGQAQTAKTSEIIKNLSHQKFEWLILKDTAKLAQVLAADAQYIHSNGWMESKTDVLNDIITGKLIYMGITVLTDTVRLYHKTAILTGKGLFKVLMEGKEVELTLLYTEVYTLLKKRWLLVQRNACKVV